MDEISRKSEIVLYKTEDGEVKLEVRLENENMWLTQAAMAELFQTTPQNMTIHLKAIYSEGELSEGATCKDSLQVQKEGKRQVSRARKFYNLQAIIAVGYRVNSVRGTQFRQWATQRLNEYLVKGFTMDDERLKEGANIGSDYFDEILERIRDIRSSEKRFYQKIRDIYKLAVDYDPKAEETLEFFRIVQNKLHFAISGKTAAELIAERADASKTNMGLTSWKGSKVRPTDVTIAKNYLNAQEIEGLNRIVTMYLEFAEMQALSQKPMAMNDWTKKLDDFLIISDRELLTHSGKISHETAINKVHAEYEKFHLKTMNQPSPIEDDFITFEKGLNRVELIHKQKEENSGIK